MQVAEQLAMDIMAPEKEEPHKQLSNREFEIFNMLACGQSLTEIAEQLHLSVKTVSTHKSHILGKMGLHSLADLVQYAIAHHFLLPPEK